LTRKFWPRTAKGLIAMSGCLASEIPDWIMKDQLDKARDAVDFFKQTLGAENFFLELQNHGIPEQAKVNRHLIKWAKEFGLKLVATNDVHYINKSDSHAHDCLVCIGTQDLLSNPKRMSAMHYEPEQFFLRSAEEMKARFAETPEAVTNTLEVAEKCNLEIEFRQIALSGFSSAGTFHARRLFAQAARRRACTSVTASTRGRKAKNLSSRKLTTRNCCRRFPRNRPKF
jgi:DNA polymerase-3 subunit alpha